MSNIKLFESKKIRSIWNEKENKWYFSVQDVVEALTDSSDVKQYLKKMLSRDELLKRNWGTICTLVTISLQMCHLYHSQMSRSYHSQMCH